MPPGGQKPYVWRKRAFAGKAKPPAVKLGGLLGQAWPLARAQGKESKRDWIFSQFAPEGPKGSAGRAAGWDPVHPVVERFTVPG